MNFGVKFSDCNFSSVVVSERMNRLFNEGARVDRRRRKTLILSRNDPTAEKIVLTILDGRRNGSITEVNFFPVQITAPGENV